MEIHGENTRILSKLQIGDPILLLGPLGNYVEIHPYQKILLIGDII